MSTARRNILTLLCCLSILLPLVAAINEPVPRLRDQCTEIRDKCECISILSDLQIQCPYDEPKFVINVRPVDHIMIQCINMNYRDYKLMPRMQVGNTTRVQIQDCPLPGHLPISSILQQLGVTGYTTLMFSSKNDLVTNITRDHLKGLHPLARLRFSSSHLLHMPADLFSHDSLKNLTWIDLRSNNVELPADIFAPLEKLEFIELANNQLKSLPRGFFRNQKNLKTLNLWSNQLRNLTTDTFQDLRSLKELDLSDNGIETFHHDVFADLTNMSNINLSYNRFHSLPEGIFKTNHNLKIVRLTNNMVPLRSLPKGFLANLPELTEIRLSTGLESIPGDLFSNSTELDIILITNNKLGTLPVELFESQIKLQHLDLSNNQLTNLPDYLFHNTKNLKVLKLHNNQLTEISDALFSTLSELKELDLSNNHLTIISKDAFARAQNLEIVNLENNRLSFSEQITTFLEAGISPANIASPLQAAMNLKRLNLKNNSLMYICQDWRMTLPELQELDLSYNNITVIDDDDVRFLNKHELHVNLTHNQLRMVNFFAINIYEEPIAMTRIDVNDNPMECDCSLVQFVQYLRGENGPRLQQLLKINADNLRCTSPEKLSGQLLRDVHPRDLLCPYDHKNSNPKRCPQGCDCWIRKYDNMLMVNCSNGNLTHLPMLPNIEGQLAGTELYVENNTLVELPLATTPGYSSVVKIYAAGNNLSSIEGSQLPNNLALFDVRRNNLKYFNESTINFLNESQALKLLYLSGNPWNCDCDAKPLFMFAQRKYDLIEDFSQMACVNFPTAKYIGELSITDICSENDIYLAMGIAISVMGLLIGSLAALYYKYNKEIKIWLYAKRWPFVMWCITEKELDKDKKYDAFISYSHKDEQFIAEYLVPELENGNPRYKLCVHVRDWLVGECIPDQIIRSVEDSCRTIVVLSQNFIDSVWAKMEFKAAHQASLNEGRARIIVIIYGDIGNIDNLDSDLKAYLKMNTYLKWGDPWFWSKLRYAMPHHTVNENDMRGLVKTALKGSTDDKLELIKPSPLSPELTTPPGENTKNPLVAHLNGGGGGAATQTAVTFANGKTPAYYTSGKTTTTTTTTTMPNGHINGAFIINTNAKQSDV
ncbi:protein toll-like [Musca vetustissima]|uniref:protein toll-like n=1 Tax=Musca vetustissima TaxID=27455 RepID=UPI002AB6E19F|nr:protein toll-like [Musca vetustissima]